LLRQSGYPLPGWLFRWEMILIVVGVVIGIRNRFRDLAWLVMIIIGVVFLSDDIWPEIRLRQYAVPIIIISVGLLLIFTPKRVCRGRHRFREHGGHQEGPIVTQPVRASEAERSHDTVLDLVSIFAGIKKNVLSKQFRGGEVVCVFGGAEINLTNADFASPVVIEVVNVFGGTKLIVPSNWEVRSEVTAIFGGVDDKRYQTPNLVAERTVILRGTLMFGGVEINSF